MLNAAVRFATLVPRLQNKGKGGKNRRRGKNENESEKRELVFKEEGQGGLLLDRTVDGEEHVV